MIRYDLPAKAPCVFDGCSIIVSPRYGGRMCRWHRMKGVRQRMPDHANHMNHPWVNRLKLDA
jgi:hypothetical protein